MTATLTPEDRRKLVGILGMLGSDQDGERAAAGLLATRLLKARGIGWDQVVGVTLPYDGPHRARESGSGTLSWRARAAGCQRRPDLLTPWEACFVADLLARPGVTISPRQAAVLDRIAAKVDHATGTAF